MGLWRRFVAPKKFRPSAKVLRQPHLEMIESRLAPAAIVGSVFVDGNGNGMRESAEPGQSNVTVFVDLNNDGKLTPGTPGTIGEPFTKTNLEGKYALQVAPGTYNIRQVVPIGFVQTTKMPDPVVVSPNAAVVAGPVFGNKLEQPPPTQGGVITGRVFVDADGNGQQGVNEVGQPNVMVFIDLNNNGKLDPPNSGTVGEPATQTGNNGNYELKVGVNGEYQVLEVVPQGFTMTTPTPGKVAVANGAVVPGPHFGNQLLPPPPPQGGVVTGRVFIDADGDTMLDPNEVGQGGVLVFVDLNNNGKFDPATSPGAPGDLARLTNSQGFYEFKLANNGEYQILEVVPAGYTMTTPTPGKIMVAGGAVVTGPLFGNQLLPPPPVQGGIVRGGVFVDLNGNGMRENNEPGQAGVTVFVDLNNDGKFNPPTSSNVGEPFTKTNVYGRYELKIKADGEFSVLEVVPPGFKMTTPPPAKVTVSGGALVSGPVFGNQPAAVSVFGAASGRVFFDANSNGKHDLNEPGMPGVRIYDDANNNGDFDLGERTTLSGIGGRYILALTPGDHALRQEVPTGFVQTLAPGTVTIVSGQVTPHQNFGNAKSLSPTPIMASIPGNGVPTNPTTPIWVSGEPAEQPNAFHAVYVGMIP